MSDPVAHFANTLLQEENKKLYQKLDLARTALRIYGDTNNWSKPYTRQGKIGRQCKGILHTDGGKIANDALELIK